MDRQAADIIAKCQADLLSQTRLQALPNFSKPPAVVWLKREDESGFGISGCKKRKYASLLPHLRQQGRPTLLIGGAQSNHVVGLLQLLREAQIPLRLFLKEGHVPATQGNAMLRDLLAKPEEIRWVSGEEWGQVEQLARQECPDHVLIPEGGTHPASLAGAATLWLDIERNEREQGITFDHVFIDSGTALMAAALIGMKQWRRSQAQVHVVLMAGDESYFHRQYARIRSWSQTWIGQAFEEMTQVQVYHPPVARAFGSVNATVLREVKWMASQYGVLTDPIYTAKLCYTARTVMERDHLAGNVLIIHSGGGTGLMGFGERLNG